MNITNHGVLNICNSENVANYEARGDKSNIISEISDIDFSNKVKYFITGDNDFNHEYFIFTSLSSTYFTVS